MNTLFLKKVDALLGSFLSRILPKAQKMNPDLVEVHRLLLIRPGGIGDAVLLVPAIHALRCAYPKTEIHVLAERRNAATFLLSSDTDKIFCYDRPKELLSAFFSVYDVIIDTEQWHRLSAVVARLIRSNYKIGFATNERSRMFTHGIDYSHDEHEMESFAHLLVPLAITCAPVFDNPSLSVPSGATEHAERLLADLGRPFVCLFPGASIAERRWGADNFRSLARRLLQDGLQVVVIGGAEDREAGEAIVKDGGLNLAGRTSLPETAAILKKSALLVSGDSGVLHLAVGLGTLTVSLFGPGISRKWAPRGDRHRIVNLGLDCSPCTRFGTTPPCPIQGRCIQEITVDMVFERVEGLLSRDELHDREC